MITRIVKMTFQAGLENQFIEHFEQRKHKIRAREGCHGLSLVRDTLQPYVFFTVSKWESEEALDLYRHSQLFKETWRIVKPMFAEKAEAWSTDILFNESIFQ